MDLKSEIHVSADNLNKKKHKTKSALFNSKVELALKSTKMGSHVTIFIEA
jgi:hypothetical protein